MIGSRGRRARWHSVRSIRAQLFLFYSGFIVVLICVLGLSFFFSTSRLLTQRANDTLVQLAASVSRQLDDAVKVVDETSIRVAYSSLVMETFLRYQAAPRIDTVNQQRALRDIFIAIMGPLQSVYQINLYDLKGTVVGAGATNTVSTVDLAAQPWYLPTLAQGGSRYITPPYERETRQPQHRFLSLDRLYYDRANVPIGIIEVIQDYARIFDSALSAAHTAAPWINAGRLVVFDSGGRVIFPFEGATDSAYQRYREATRPAGSEATTSIEVASHGRELVSHADSPYTGWSVVLAASETTLLGPLYGFSRLILAAGMLFLLVSVFISFLMARRLTAPIDRIHAAIRTLSIQEPPGRPAGALGSTFNELESLYHSFQAMRARLDRSIADLLASKEHEMNARLLALQSQMNPHFLANTVTTISIMAEERRGDEIIRVCDDLLFMLRYVSGSPTRTVCLRQEIEHTTSYLSLMRHRYGDKVRWTIDIPPGMMDLAVPKLIVQPLAENSLKYGINVEPPWTIGVTGATEAGQWTITVRDNGTGFSTEALARIAAGAEGARDTVDADLGGMGLQNIFARLRLLYGDQAVFRVSTMPAGGAEVVIGGRYVLPSQVVAG
jgi:two-component system sensor histidine kinase YesM